ncbi:glycosyl transferase, family 8 [Kipferlia bialata]|uniref:Glycosyl transferase, family 8 n=1 Tax=Kipferlia bialata TaxID=797122 RepID=A0A9K3CUB7_9EUKA|nr:glycosyl transferase, family 8 [Kipferlia bialata]|eukprot:g3357.t1
MFLDFGSVETEGSGTKWVFPEEFVHTPNCFVTLVMKGDGYVAGASVLAESIRHNGNASDTVCLIDSSVSDDGIKVLSAAFSHVVRVSLQEHSVTMPNWDRFKTLYDWLPACFTKLACLRLHPYSKVLFLDADMICLGVVDHVFALSAPAGVMMTRKNAGLPHGSPVTEQDLTDSMLKSYGMSGACWLLSPSEEDHKAMVAELDACGNLKYGSKTFCAGPDEQLVSQYYMKDPNDQGLQAPRMFTPWTNISRVFNCVSWQKADVESGKLPLLDLPEMAPRDCVMPTDHRRYSVDDQGVPVLRPCKDGQMGGVAAEDAAAPADEPTAPPADEPTAPPADEPTAPPADTEGEREGEGEGDVAMGTVSSGRSAAVDPAVAVRFLHYVTEKPWNADPEAPAQEKKQLWPDYVAWYESLARLKSGFGDDSNLIEAGQKLLPTSFSPEQFVSQEDADIAFGKQAPKRPREEDGERGPDTKRTPAKPRHRLVYTRADRDKRERARIEKEREEYEKREAAREKDRYEVWLAKKEAKRQREYEAAREERRSRQDYRDDEYDRERYDGHRRRNSAREEEEANERDRDRYRYDRRSESDREPRRERDDRR